MTLLLHLLNLLLHVPWDRGRRLELLFHSVTFIPNTTLMPHPLAHCKSVHIDTSTSEARENTFRERILVGREASGCP
jgi:hypothetical protein